tara:strand:- start:890 stop:1036 length:147 start_codon:yes stop_codon:yes gene_type:complete
MRMMLCTLAAALVTLTFVGCGDEDEDTGVAEDSAVEESEESEEQAEDE